MPLRGEITISMMTPSILRAAFLTTPLARAPVTSHLSASSDSSVFTFPGMLFLSFLPVEVLFICHNRTQALRPPPSLPPLTQPPLSPAGVSPSLLETLTVLCNGAFPLKSQSGPQARLLCPCWIVTRSRDEASALLGTRTAFARLYEFTSCGVESGDTRVDFSFCFFFSVRAAPKAPASA